jgi:hypothetical protein
MTPITVVWNAGEYSTMGDYLNGRVLAWLASYVGSIPSSPTKKMSKLNVFDDDKKIATITIIGNFKFLFARTSREWSDMKRLLDAAERLHEADPSADVLESLITMLHNFNYSTELSDK